MSTKWVITAAAERVVLDAQRKGETTFTVTNPGGAADRAVFDVVAGEGAQEQWFTVAEPQRLVRGGASVSYLMKVAVAGDTPPGQYAVQGMVYSVDSAPEESSVLSPRVMLEVPAEPEPVKRRLPWWWLLIAAGLVLVVLVVVGVLVFGGDGGETAAPPSVGAGEVVMPDLLGSSERDALRALADLGLTLRPIRYRHDPERADEVVLQSVEPDRAISSDTVVDLEVAVDLPVPVVTVTQGVPILPEGEPAPTLEWSRGPSYIRSWFLTVEMETCLIIHDGITYRNTCEFVQVPAWTRPVDAPAVAPELSLAVSPYAGRYHTGWVRWRVAAQDDFGASGPPTEYAVFRIGLR